MCKRICTTRKTSDTFSETSPILAKVPTRIRRLPKEQRLKILLTNGRFPVSLDIARQLHRVGHHVYVVDPMKYHVCKFSSTVQKSFHVPAPHHDAEGYVNGVRNAIKEARIDLVIPMHEEIFYLAQHEDIQRVMFAPSYAGLVSLHNKWEFNKLMLSMGIDVPKSYLVHSMHDLEQYDLSSKEYALKPVFGRASSHMYHLKPGNPLPDDCDVSDDNAYILQEWTPGRQLCSYAIAHRGYIKTCAIYPVQDTIDGNSSVYFRSIEHPRIKELVETIASALAVTGQIAFDWIETEEGVVVIECNPRATSGIHLYHNTTVMSDAFTGSFRKMVGRTDAKVGAKRQVAPGMMMWEHKGAHLKDWLTHLKKLIGTRDVTFSARDLGPALMQPFLLTSYYEICRERGLELKTMFQDDVVWAPTAEELKRAEDERDRSGAAKSSLDGATNGNANGVNGDGNQAEQQGGDNIASLVRKANERIDQMRAF